MKQFERVNNISKFKLTQNNTSIQMYIKSYIEKVIHFIDTHIKGMLISSAKAD